MPYTPTSQDVMEAESSLALRNLSNMSKGSSQQPQTDSLINRMANSSLVNGILGAGDSLASTLSAGLVNPHTGSGTAYNIGKLAGNVGGFIGGGEVLDTARLGMEGLPLVGNLAKALGSSGVANRAVGTGLYGADTDPNNRLQGAAEGVGFSGLGEIPGAAVSGIGKAAEYVNPINYSKDLGDKLQGDYQFAKNMAADLYNSVAKKFNNYKITLNNPSKDYLSTPDSTVSNYYSSAVKKLHDQYLDNPTFQNAHILQSKLGGQIGSLQQSSSDAYTHNAISALQDARASLKGDIESFLAARNPNAAADYKQASDITRVGVAPFKSNDYISDIVNGKKDSIDPQKLLSNLNSVLEKNEIKPNHWLNEARDQLQQKVNRGNAAASLLPAAGAAIGELAYPGVGSGVTGLIAGKMFGPSALRLAQNPSVVSGVQRAEPFYDTLRKSLMANILPGNQQ